MTGAQVAAVVVLATAVNVMIAYTAFLAGRKLGRQGGYRAATDDIDVMLTALYDHGCVLWREGAYVDWKTLLEESRVMTTWAITVTLASPDLHADPDELRVAAAKLAADIVHPEGVRNAQTPS